MEKESFYFSYMILFLTIVASHSLASTRPRCHDDERSALLGFKATFFTSKLESWNASTEETQSDCCSWAGVECDKVSGHVIGLDLSHGRLSGEINSNTSIFRLHHLRSLNLAFNEFDCQIPSAIGNLGSLRDLNLSYSNFMGHIPHSLSNLTQLVHLDLLANGLNGTTAPLENLTLLEHLDLGINSFTGEVPSFLGNLVHLRYLNLADNLLTGRIPSSLENLVQLTSLDLRLNQLTGEIPFSIGNLVQLTDLDLGYNQLVGEIPLSSQNLTELRSFTLQSNQLSGEIPSLLGRLTQLIDVDLSDNQFHGAIPNTIFQLQNLRSLYLNSNNLSGTVKLDSFSEAKNLRELVLSSNKLSLTIETNITQRFSALGLGSCNLNGFPEFLKEQDNLVDLDLSSNNISGRVPQWFLNVSTENLLYLNLSGNFLTSFAQNPVIFKWRELFAADLSFNVLQGPVPIPPPQINNYYISNNKLSGGIAPLMCNLSFLWIIDLSGNNLTGFLPQCFSNLIAASEVVNLRGNNLVGKIPHLNGHYCNLVMIDLSDNKLQGPLPRWLRKCSSLEFLNVGDNQIRDVFPSWLGSLPSLKILILRHNRFRGLIGEPGGRIAFPKLQIIDLSQNSFSGSLPSKYLEHWTAMKVSDTRSFPSWVWPYHSSYIGVTVQQFRWPSSVFATFDYSMSIIAKGIQMNYSKIQEHLTLIDLSSNNFSGAIPETMGSLKQLKLLNLSNNILSGPLPSCLANLSNLESLDLSQNRLSGEIPQELTQVTSLEVFDLSYNHLSGPIPRSRQFATFENTSYKGNSGLCGTPLSRKCGDPEASPPSSPTSEEDQDSWSAMELDWKIVCMGYASGLVIGVVLGNCLITRRRAQRLVKNFGKRKQRRRR